ncbi:unnamed protein product [Rangifer tarandus platyrhynchus]|uniref:Uncharacterized protein n=2 Tax=Rangifer tarandus platyrhynchus TaxID=3082113 RepID=A0ACB0F3T1_RANTA|nr:unnamed protein product [Rangifer tarandus platyrhynchus]CAI9706771.1 unnamed protein product [Rangifer tarandus platyrhynchus]
MRSGGGDDAQRAGDEQSWPGRLHGHPNPPALDGFRSPAKLGLPGPPPPSASPSRARAAMDFVSGPETPQSPGADSPAPPEHLFWLGLRRWPQVRPPPAPRPILTGPSSQLLLQVPSTPNRPSEHSTPTLKPHTPAEVSSNMRR